MIELTYNLRVDRELVTKTILYCTLQLTKKEMIQALRHEAIFINDKYYKVPEKTLLFCLTNEKFGEIPLELEQIKKP